MNWNMRCALIEYVLAVMCLDRQANIITRLRDLIKYSILNKRPISFKLFYKLFYLLGYNELLTMKRKRI